MTHENWQDWATTDVTDGVTTQVKVEDGALIVRDSFDADPFLKAAEQSRQQTDGQRWGDGKKIGTIPPAVLSRYFEIVAERGNEEGDKFVHEFFVKNPAFVHFEKYLK
jgi:hypothetical protein